MRRTPVVAAVVAAMIGSAVPACDLVFAPGKGPGATADAPPGRDATIGGDGSSVADAPTDDAAAGTPDAPTVTADACAGYVCYAPDPIPGTPNPNNPGLAGCETTVDDACAAHPEVVAIDVCTCSAGGSAELYVLPTGPSSAVIAFVGPAPAATWSLVTSSDLGNCFGGGACTHEGPCFFDTPLWVWEVPIAPGSLNQFSIFDDTGGGCGPQPPAFTFTIAL